MGDLFSIQGFTLTASGQSEHYPGGDERQHVSAAFLGWMIDRLAELPPVDVAAASTVRHNILCKSQDQQRTFHWC
ncbi:hypothetical protein RB195_025667 [Necator americanus]|uniref:Uncharacterized protein n=1 Tax=Necator americanus TaxID=51031 RepID=A0ABR1ETC0_NECAM